ncbi:WD repeat-containing protein 76 isoform X2 [Clupea harengus]|nr:WD repeat-containing protein 76 isoform X2 [Clupea harengus]
MTENGKTYELPEYYHRLNIFTQNSRRILEHNEDRHGFTMGLNQFSDLTFAEFKKAFLLHEPQNCSATTGSRLRQAGPYPEFVDWRARGNYVTPVKSQGHCGSCWTFSTTGCLESVTAIATGKLLELSEQQLIDCAQDFNNHGCFGGLPSQAFEYIKYRGCLMTEDGYPYRGNDSTCNFQPGLAAAFVKDVVNITREVTPPQYPDLTEPNGTSKPVRQSVRNRPAPKRLSNDVCTSVNPKRGTKRTKDKLKEMEDSMKLENSDRDPKENEQIGLSEYELERLENIRHNQAFLSSLNLPQVAELLSTKKKPSQLGLKREKVVKEVLPARKSLRLQNKDAEPTAMPNLPAELKQQEVEEHSLEGPVPMCPLNLEEDGRLPESLIHLWTEQPVYNGKKVDLKMYKEGLQKMCVDEERVVKVVKGRIFSAAFHPCASSLLMAAGDWGGRVGLWNLEANWGDNGVLLFKPHTRPVTYMAFSRSQPSTLITTSYDGAARAGDIERAMFEELYCSDKGLKGFDFLSHDCTTLLIGDAQGDVAIVDTRTPGTSHESLHTLDPKTLRSVHVHPVQKQYFVVAVNSGVHIYDVRSLKKRSTQPVSELYGHTRSVSYAYFSPDTGNRVLTTSWDDKLRVFDTSQVVSSAPLMTSIRHCTQTGRWLSKLQAVWDPRQEDCFVVGSLQQPPRRIEVFHESGQLAHTFDSLDHLTTVCSVTAFHPSRAALLGGNASGRLHVFT